MIECGLVDPAHVVASVRLDLEGRRKRRHVIERSDGAALLIDLAAPPSLRDGDGLLLEDGTVVRVEAEPEPLAEITAGDPERLIKIAWHLGNRHWPVQFTGHGPQLRLRLRRDHVIEAMLERLGATVRHIEAPFDPEPGAYGSGHDHTGGHDHGHG